MGAAFVWIGFAVLLALGAVAYVRLAPVDVSRFHQAIEGAQDRDGKGYCLRVIADDEGLLGRIDAVMRALPRTRVVAGSVADGRITYVTRSKVIGFPDYTTVEAEAGQIKLFARLRFGGSDMGVNRARLRHVLNSVGAA